MTRISKILVILFTLFSFTFLNSEIGAFIDSIVVLSLSASLAFAFRKDRYLFILLLLIFYSNYSIVMGEYIMPHKSIPLNEVKYVYNDMVKYLMLFMSTLFISFIDKKRALSTVKMVDNFPSKIIFYVLVVFIILSGVFGIDRNLTDSYKVRISPLYEYSKLFFILAYMFSFKKFHKYLIYFLILLFILQDFYYGGRITSLQLIIFSFFVLKDKSISASKSVVYILFGFLVLTFVGSIRNSQFDILIGIEQTISDLKGNYLIFDTATHAYYSSATVFASSKLVPPSIKFDLFIDMLRVFTSGQDLTTYISSNHFGNVGGGIIFAYFYFFGGFIGVVLSALLIAYLLGFRFSKNKYKKIIFLNLLISVPRWYLYSPVSIYKGSVIYPVFGLFILYYMRVWFFSSNINNLIYMHSYQKPNRINY